MINTFTQLEKMPVDKSLLKKLNHTCIWKMLLEDETVNKVLTTLRSKNYFSGSFDDVLKTIWFKWFAEKGKKKYGFQQVFMYETKNGNISGIQNWIFYKYKEHSGEMLITDIKREQKLENVKKNYWN